MTTAAAAIVAVIYVPPADFDPHALRCTEACEARGWTVYGITPDWADAVQLKEAGVVDKIVVGRSDHIDPSNLPGVEVIAAVRDVAQRPERRRPRLLRRPRD